MVMTPRRAVLYAATAAWWVTRRYYTRLYGDLASYRNADLAPADTPPVPDPELAELAITAENERVVKRVEAAVRAQRDALGEALVAVRGTPVRVRVRRSHVPVYGAHRSTR